MKGLCNLTMVLALIIGLSAGLVLLPSVSSAKTDVVYASYKYVMGDNDTKNDAKRICFIEAKRRCLEKAGTYIESQTEVHNYQLTKDEIRTYTAALVKVEVANEEIKFEGESIAIFMTVKAKVDNSYIDKQLSRIRADKSLKQKLEQQNARLQELERNYVELQKQLNSAKPTEALTLRKKRVTVFKEIDETEKKYAEITRSMGKRKNKSVEQAQRILQFVEIGMTPAEVEYILGKPDKRTGFAGKVYELSYGRIGVKFSIQGYVSRIEYNSKTLPTSYSKITIKTRGYNVMVNGINIYKMRLNSKTLDERNYATAEIKQYVLGK